LVHKDTDGHTQRGGRRVANTAASAGRVHLGSAAVQDGNTSRADLRFQFMQLLDRHVRYGLWSFVDGSYDGRFVVD
jgi:hypothetical protein